MFCKGLATNRSYVVVLALLLPLLDPANLGATGLFAPVQAYPSGGDDAVAVAVADVNGDGIPDLLVAHGCQLCPDSTDGVIGVLLGNGDGTFQGAKTYSYGANHALSITVADVNGDGRIDVIVATQCLFNCVSFTGALAVLLGGGDGTFHLEHSYNPGGAGAAFSVVAADVNGDGKPDLIVANGRVGVLLGRGDGTFQTARSYATGGSGSGSVAVGDVNGDGIPDILVATEVNSVAGGGEIGVLLGNGDGTFRSAKVYPAGAFVAKSIAVADLNNDGKADLIVANGGVGILLGNGDGSFASVQNFDSGGFNPQSLAVGDVNSDGNIDVLVANICALSTSGSFCAHGTVGVLLGDGKGGFSAPLSRTSGGVFARSVVVADLNADRRPDVVVANECFSLTNPSCAPTDPGGVAVLLSTSHFRTFTELTSSLNPSIFGQTVVLTATVTSVGPTPPTGTVIFKNGLTAVGSSTLVGSVATITKTNLPAGSLSITALYTGDTVSARSTSLPVGQVVQQATTTTSIKASPNPSVQGQLVKFTAKVSSPTARPVGTVTFTAGSTTLGTITLSGGSASLSTDALRPGSATIRAIYSGTPNIIGSSASLIQIVN